jgi:carbon storage regulator CsrA
MLVLTRKSQDSIRIGDHIKVTILRIKGNTVRIGVEAPEDIRIVRGELPHFGDLPEDSSSTDVTPVREPATGLGSTLPPANRTTSKLDVADQEKSSRMPTAPRRKTYMPPRTEQEQRSHPISGNHLPTTENISVSGTGLPLPPR